MYALLAASLAALPVSVTRGVVYRTAPPLPNSGAVRELALDFYEPVTAEAGPHPLAIFIHGGSWSGGQRQDMAGFCEKAARHGMAAATVSYRLAPADRWPAMLDDVKAAVRFFRERAGDYKIDPDRIGAAGASAGGHLALLLGAVDDELMAQPYPGRSSRVKAVVNVFGPTDLTKDYPEILSAILSQTVLGKPLRDAGDDIRLMSPVNWISAGDAPVFTIHGSADTLVPPKQAERLAEALAKAGIPHETVIVEGLGHQNPDDLPAGAAAVDKALVWLKAKL
jgi:acetyl esterase/lipase